MSEAERLRESAAMVQRLADQQTTIALRNHLLSTARGWRRMAEKAEAEERFVQQMEAALPVASISSRAA
jgi:hypothetical protein